MSQGSAFQDGSTDCAICLEPLEGKERVITLTCGHKWHYQCIVEQLQTAQPTPSQRLLFSGCQCAKCGSICDHPELKDLTRTTDVLREKVDSLLEEHVAVDAPEDWKKAKSNAKARKSLMDQARRQYAVYLCGHCKEPYVGGTLECADRVVEGDETRQSADERLCVACAPQSQVACQNPLEHRGHLVWKCRYCCRPSTHVCYGNVHFCDHCHERNGRRVLRQRGNTSRPPPLSPIPCPGATCEYPKLDSMEFHSNGPTMKSEQVYGCACCQSMASTRLHQDQGTEPGSTNLLKNPSGQLQLQHWRNINPRMAWKVEQSDIPVSATTTTNFVSSFLPCVMEQTIDLSTVFSATTNASIAIEVSARYMARTDCPSVFGLEAIVCDVHRRPVAQQKTQALEAPPDYWERASVRLDNIQLNRARYVSVIVMGKDKRFWQGAFGSKAADISLRILGSSEELENLGIQPQYLAATVPGDTRAYGQNGNQTHGNTHPNNTNGNPLERGNIGNGQQPEVSLKLLRDGILPIFVFLILGWFLQRSPP